LVGYVSRKVTVVIFQGYEMDKSQKENLARVLNYVMTNEEKHYEEILDEYGVESEQAENHIYSLARDLWTEHELDFSEEENV